jgi:transposase InsO family protein
MLTEATLKPSPELQLDQSFGPVGDRYDNAAVEAFFANLKR